jgi:TatD DNase family protein
VRLYDAHNHLQDQRLTDPGAIVNEAVRTGVVRMVVNGACEDDWPQVQQLAKSFPQVMPSFGYHPWYLHERTPEWQQRLVEFLDDTPSSVVGEIGLDRWKQDLPYEGQEEAFVWQLQLAAERNVAASIHCLQAWGRMHELLQDTPRPARGFLLHSYGGSKELVAPLAKLGAYFSFPGYFMHERKTRQREAFAAVPLDRLLIETDAPDQLPPDSANHFPLRDANDKPLNHPANLRAIYEFMAQERTLPLEKFAAQMEENFRRLFG